MLDTLFDVQPLTRTMAATWERVGGHATRSTGFASPGCRPNAPAATTRLAKVISLIFGLRGDPLALGGGFAGTRSALHYCSTDAAAGIPPRDTAFLCGPQRLTVAPSPARCAAPCVGSPESSRVQCRAPRRVRVAHVLAQRVPMAVGIATAS